ncbi:unnamed protein product [Brachionus calyciflorus]|uniref:Tc1-like transposase DDE domain-containing protein n=1 Tax=Brachionus calyciflorus TaxID=104777 RepID=A0A813ZW87_9BILA|nr:unnamed protein product [Brachionus calyciflorus]
MEPDVDPFMLIYDVKPLSKLDLLSYEETIDLIIKQLGDGLYLEYRFCSDLDKARRKIIYEKCDLKNIKYSKSGTRYVIVTIGLNIVRNVKETLKNAKKMIAKELKASSQVECPRDENVNKILIENEEPVERGIRGIRENLDTELYRIKTQPKSPDLNPIELVWNEMKIFIRKQNVKNEEEARFAIKEFEESLKVEKCKAYICINTNKNQNISDSVPNEDLPDDNNNLNDFLTEKKRKFSFITNNSRPE